MASKTSNQALVLTGGRNVIRALALFSLLSVVTALAAAAATDDPWRKAGADEGLRQAFMHARHAGKGPHIVPLVGGDSIWAEQQEMIASDADALGDNFGISVAVDGDTAVIGAATKNNAAGAAYAFVRSGGVWTQQQELAASDGVGPDEFGVSVSVSGDTALIGADQWNLSQGSAYVFVRSGGVWTQQAELTAPDGVRSLYPPGGGDGFGTSVSVSGTAAVVGAPGHNGGQGATYVFVQAAGVWTQQQELTASDGVAGDGFGGSVSVSGTTAVIGANGKNGSQGAAYVFVRSGSTWSQQQELTAAPGAGYPNFGFSVSVSGDTAVIGSDGSDEGQGAAYVFVRSGSTWSQQQELTASDGAAWDDFGGEVSVSGDTAVIGASAINDDEGAAYVFVRTGGIWTQQQELTASDGAPGDCFCYVSVSGDTIVIGANWKNGVRGAAYAFVRPRLGANSLLVGSAAGTS